MSAARPHVPLATAGAHLLRMGQAIGIASIGGLLPATARDLHFGLDQNRLPLFLFALGFLVGLPAGRSNIAPKTSTRLCLVTCTGFMAAMLLWGLSVSYPMYAAAFLVLGFMAAWQELSTNPLMAELYPKGMATALNLLHALYCLWAFLGPQGARQWLAMEGSWRAIPLITLPVFLAGILCLWLAEKKGAFKSPSLLEEPAAITQPVPDASIPVPWLLILMVVIYSGSSFTLNAWAPSVLHEKFHIPVARTAALIGGFYGLMLLGRLLWAWLSPKWGARFLLGATGIGSALAHAALLFAPAAKSATWSLWVTGFFIGSIVPLALAIEGERHPGLMRKVTTWVFVGMGFGMLIFPPGAGWIAGQWGLHVILPISLTLNLIMAVMTAILAWPRRVTVA